MREILFRGKSKKTGQWLVGSLVEGIFTSAEGDLMYIVDPRELTTCNTWAEVAVKMDELEVENNSIGQSTDINDMDGNLIFEGMIVNQKSVSPGDKEDRDFTGIVTFDEGCWWIESLNDAVRLFSEDRENKIIE